MYLDSGLAQPEELESPSPYHEKQPFTYQELSKMKQGLPRLIKSTAGLITWLSDIINELEAELDYSRKQLAGFIIFVISIFLIPILAVYFMYTSGSDVLLVLAFIPIYLIFQFTFIMPQFLVNSWYMFNIEWLSSVRTSQIYQLEESLNEIFTLLRSEFLHPLRFHLVRDYPLLNYTGRTKTNNALVQLKEAVLYPYSIQNEMLP